VKDLGSGKTDTLASLRPLNVKDIKIIFRINPEEIRINFSVLKRFLFSLSSYNNIIPKNFNFFNRGGLC